MKVKEEEITLFLRTVEPETWFTMKANLQGALRFLLDAQILDGMTTESFLSMTKAFVISEEDAAKLPPPTVALGQTPDEVAAILGKPIRVVNLGTST